MSESDNGHGQHTSERALMVAESFVHLADALVDDFDVVELLDRLVADCVSLLDVSAAAILVVRPDRTLEVVASSNEASRLMEVYQTETRSGPCVQAIRTGEQVAVTDPAQIRRRWPAFGAAAEGVGFTAVYAVPMRVRDEMMGAVNLFSSGQPPLSVFDRRLAQALADVATIAIMQQRALSRASALTEQLQEALTSRITVEQAKGLVSEYGGVDMGAAFEAIRAFARERRIKLSVVAHALVNRDMTPGDVIAESPRR